MNQAITHPDGLPADLDLDALLGDLSFDLASDEIVGEMPLEPEQAEVIEPADEEPKVEQIESTETIEAAPEAALPEPPTVEALPGLDLDALLALDVVPEPETPAQTLSDDEAQALDLSLTKADAYETQETEGTLADDAIEAAPGAIVAKPEPKKRAASAGAAKSPRVAKDITTLAAEHFVLLDGDAPDDAAKAALIAKRPKQIKIAEKFDNVIAALAIGRRPSTYVMDCFAVLDARKEAQGSDLVAALTAHGYTIGTARSQAGQIMELFTVLGIACRAGQKLTLQDTSSFAAKLRALPAA